MKINEHALFNHPYRPYFETIEGLRDYLKLEKQLINNHSKPQKTNWLALFKFW